MGDKNVYERFVWFDVQVRAKRYPSASTLAERFEISAKTAQRDIEFMRDRFHCPLAYDTSRKGYFYTQETYALPAIYLSAAELSGLLIARKILCDISQDRIGREVTAVADKITSILNKRLSDAGRIDDVISFQLIEYASVPEETVRTVLESCLEKKRLVFTYYSPGRDERMPRKVDPYHLLNYMGTWHLIAYCHTRQDMRDFHLGRMSDMEKTDDLFEIQPHFDIHTFLTDSFGIYKGTDVQDVTLRFTPEKAKWIAGQVWHKDQKEKRMEDGSLELTIPVAEFGEISREILKHGSGVEVIAPQALRDLVRDEARKVLGIYTLR